MTSRLLFAAAVVAMAAVVVVSNVAVQYPVQGMLGALDLADILTWGAFTYPVAFLVTDLTNRRLGATTARVVVAVGFVIAVALSVWLATPRIAIASGSAFLTAQLLDITIFNRLRRQAWWRAPVISSVLGSVLDTALFFGLAFAPILTPVLGFGDDFATGLATFGGLELPRWIAWALGDLSIKLLVAGVLLVPYRVLMAWLRPFEAAAVPAR